MISFVYFLFSTEKVEHLALIEEANEIILNIETIEQGYDWYWIKFYLLFSIVLDEPVQGVRVRNPSDQARVGGERDDGEPLDGQVPPEGLSVADEERVDEAEKLHHSLVLPQVLVALQQEHVGAAVAATDAELPRPLLRGDDLQRGLHLHDADQLRVGNVAAGNGEFEIPAVEQLGRDVLQFELRQLRQLA